MDAPDAQSDAGSLRCASPEISGTPLYFYLLKTASTCVNRYKKEELTVPEADHDDPGASLLTQSACTSCSTVPRHTSTFAFRRTGIVQHGAVFCAIHSPRAGKME
ncbi:hypothetical protein ACRFBE_08620 [Klebsiella pneumoniae]